MCLRMDNKRASRNEAKTSGFYPLAPASSPDPQPVSGRGRNVSTDLQLTFYPVSLSAVQDAHIPNVLASFLTSLWEGTEMCCPCIPILVSSQCVVLHRALHTWFKARRP